MNNVKKVLYEIDPNSSFNQLKTLQRNLKEEVSLRDTFIKKQDDILKQIDKDCIEYYAKKIAIQEIYDKATKTRMNPGEPEKDIKYEIISNPQGELPQCFDPINKLMFHFRNNNSLMLSLIDKCDSSKYEDLCNILCHFFYNNLFSPNCESGNLLVIIYLLLEKEVDQIKSENSSFSFLDGSVSFVSKLLKFLSRKVEVKEYLENVLSKIIIDLEQLNGANKKKYINQFISMEPTRIKEYLKDHLKYKINKSKRVTDFKAFLTENLKSSSVFEKIQKSKEDIVCSSVSAFYDENPDRIENNIIDSSVEEEDSKDDLETLFQESGLFNISPSDTISSSNTENIQKDYTIELDKNRLVSKIQLEKSECMKDFYIKQVHLIENDSNIYTNQKFIDDLVSSNKDGIEKIILLYKYSFEKTKMYLDEILSAILESKKSIPYIIKCVCCIIDKLISIKFQNISQVEKNAFVGEFFFGTIIFTMINNPGFNGLILRELNMTEEKKSKFIMITKILRKLLRGTFFSSTKENESLYTIFNTYFIEVMPCVFDIFESLKNVVLPSFIEQLINDKKYGVENRNIEYNYLKEFPEDRLEHQSMCFTFQDFLIFYQTIKDNEEQLAGDKTSMFYKTFKKIGFHEETLKKKIENDIANNKRRYIFLSKTNFDEELSASLNAKKSQKFSFQGNDIKESDTENFVLTRVKYGISTIIRHLNILTRANFFVDESESTENFVKGLSKMIELEGFSEMLKEKTIPLSWFGLYVTANIESIPAQYKRANYNALYKEMVDDSEKNLKAIQNDNSLNIIFSRIKISEKLIEEEENNLKQMEKIRKKFKIVDFITKTPISISIKVQEKNNQFNGIQIEVPSSGHVKAFGRSKHSSQKVCSTLEEFANCFPLVAGQVDYIEVLTLEEKVNMPGTLSGFFDKVGEIAVKSPVFKDYTKEEIENDILFDIYNYVHEKIYHKICPEMAVKEDINIYQKCVTLSWIKPEHLDSSYGGINEEILDLSVRYISKMDTEISPLNKIKAFEKADELITSLKYLSGINADPSKKLNMYATIKAQPEKLLTNYNYITMYLNTNQKELYDYLIKKLKTIIETIEVFSFKELVGVTEEEFKKNEQAARAGKIN